MALAAKDRFDDRNLNIPLVIEKDMHKIDIKYKSRKLAVIGVFTGSDDGNFLIASDDKGNVYRVSIALNPNDTESLWRIIRISSIPPK